MFLSFINGFLYTLTLFILCLFLVVGAKSFLLAVKLKFFTKKQPQKQVKRARKKPTTAPKKIPATVRSIEINADEIDKIYFKRSS